ncbi:MAG: alpha-amylase family glycosyl hydrolase [Oscillospiraceae bacterium]|nr:alpha-amylase family glycosyl hydrolase [Oscillospiraceae bacterium]
MPKWLDNAVFYEIYPQSFHDTNADGIGDFEGIIQKLDYIKMLGCNAIWINPCFESPFNDAGYDISDYYKVAPRYGTNDDLKRLLKEAHHRNIHVLFDLVPGHTSIEHPWFRESMKNEQNEYTHRYIWTDNTWEPPLGLSYLRGVSDRDGACGVNYYSTQPALNYGYANPTRPYMKSPDHPAALANRDEMKNIMRFWMDMGCDGFRVDMAATLIKNDPDRSENIKLWQEFREFFDKEYPDCAMISEWGEPQNAIAGGFHMDFLLHVGPAAYTSLFRSENPFFSKAGTGDISVFANQYSKFYNTVDGKGLICIPSGNHDMHRLRENRDIDDMKLCFVFLLTMPGSPFIYYGDEIGMKYLPHVKSKEKGYHRTGSRSPMQWDNTQNTGFSKADSGSLYIPIDPDENRPTVKDQLSDNNSLLKTVSDLIRMRLETPALQNCAGFRFVYAQENKYPLVYERSDGDNSYIIIINPANRQESCILDIELDGALQIYSVGGQIEIAGNKITAKPVSAAIFKVN